MPPLGRELSPETEAIERHSAQVAKKILAIQSHYHSQTLTAQAAVDQQRETFEIEIQAFRDQINAIQSEIASREQALEELQHEHRVGARERAKAYSAALRTQLNCPLAYTSIETKEQPQGQLMSPRAEEHISHLEPMAPGCDEIVVASPPPAAPKAPAQDQMRNSKTNPQASQKRVRTGASAGRIPSSKRRRGKTITYEEVFQNGIAEQKHAIVEFPKGERKWYILLCDVHQMSFGLKPLLGASRHLRSHNASKTWTHAATVKRLGVEVIGCDPERAMKNNDRFRAQFQEAIEEDEEPLVSSRTRQDTPSAASQQPMPIFSDSSRESSFEDTEEPCLIPDDTISSDNSAQQEIAPAQTLTIIDPPRYHEAEISVDEGYTDNVEQTEGAPYSQPASVEVERQEAASRGEILIGSARPQDPVASLTVTPSRLNMSTPWEATEIVITGPLQLKGDSKVSSATEAEKHNKNQQELASSVASSMGVIQTKPHGPAGAPSTSAFIDGDFPKSSSGTNVGSTSPSQGQLTPRREESCINDTMLEHQNLVEAALSAAAGFAPTRGFEQRSTTAHANQAVPARGIPSLAEPCLTAPLVQGVRASTTIPHDIREPVQTIAPECSVPHPQTSSDLPPSGLRQIEDQDLRPSRAPSTATTARPALTTSPPKPAIPVAFPDHPPVLPKYPATAELSPLAERVAQLASRAVSSSEPAQPLTYKRPSEEAIRHAMDAQGWARSFTPNPPVSASVKSLSAPPAVIDLTGLPISETDRVMVEASTKSGVRIDAPSEPPPRPVEPTVVLPPQIGSSKVLGRGNNINMRAESSDSRPRLPGLLEPATPYTLCSEAPRQPPEYSVRDLHPQITVIPRKRTKPPARWRAWCIACRASDVECDRIKPQCGQCAQKEIRCYQPSPVSIPPSYYNNASAQSQFPGPLPSPCNYNGPVNWTTINGNSQN